MNLIRIAALLALLVSPLLLGADPAPQAASTQPAGENWIKAGHRAAAQKFFDSLNKGVKLSGVATENGSIGRFEAYFVGDTWTVRQTIGGMVSMSYDGPEGVWAGSNFSLPYKIEAEDNPTSETLNLLTSGKYLEEPYWSAFSYVDDVAGGFNFLFAPEGLPTAKVVLYSDSSDPQYLQIMSIEVRLSPNDADSNTYRGYYYYKADADGNIYTNRETGRELDSKGETSIFSEYNVEKVEHVTELPADAQFNFARTPVGGVGDTLAAPIEVPVDVSGGYFLVPLTFAGSDQTWNFILDTGASASLFTPEAAAAAQLKSEINVPAHGHGSSVDVQMGLCTTASVGRADAPPEQHAPLAPFPTARVSEDNKDVLNAFASYGVAGIIGVTLLHQYVLTLDHSAGKITFTPPHLFNAADIPTPNVEFWLDVEDLLYMTAYLGDGVSADPLKGEVAIDTGLQQQLSILRETIDHAGIHLAKTDERNNTVLGGTRSFDYVTVPEFNLGPLKWENIEASMTDDDKGTLSARGLLGFLGVPFFFGTRVTIDTFGQRMYVQPPSEEEMQDLAAQLHQLNVEAEAAKHKTGQDSSGNTASGGG